jgi:hypothetical protein
VDERIGRPAVQQDRVGLVDDLPRLVERGLRLVVQPLRPFWGERSGPRGQV